MKSLLHSSCTLARLMHEHKSKAMLANCRLMCMPFCTCVNATSIDLLLFVAVVVEARAGKIKYGVKELRTLLKAQVRHDDVVTTSKSEHGTHRFETHLIAVRLSTVDTICPDLFDVKPQRCFAT